LFLSFKNNFFIGIDEFIIGNIIRVFIRFTSLSKSSDMICTFIIWFLFIIIFIRSGNRITFMLFLEMSRTLRSNVTKTLTTITLKTFSLVGLFFSFSLSLRITVLADVRRYVLDIRSTSSIHSLQGIVKLSSKKYHNILYFFISLQVTLSLFITSVRHKGNALVFIFRLIIDSHFKGLK